MDGYCCFKLPGDADFYEIKGVVKSFEKKEDIFNKTGFVMAPFFNGNSKKLFIEGKALKGLSIDEINLPESTEYFKSTSKHDFKRMFDKTMHALNSREAEKIVLSKIKVFKLTETFQAISFVKILANKYPSAFVYLFVTQQICWLGVSPELLMKYYDTKAETVALAGTISSNQKNRFTSKEKEEQDIITRYIRDILHKNNIRNYLNSGPEEIKAGHLKHLSTTFSFDADLNQAYKLVSELHPTPAVCGMPKAYSLNFIEKTENHQRAYYSGYMGPCQSNSFSFYVNLRCAQVFKQKIILYAGAGITQASIFENEWEETENKLNIISVELMKHAENP